MNNNQLFFGTKILKLINNIFTKTTFAFNSLLAKTKFQIVALIFFCSITNLSYGQLNTENFNSGIPATWAITSNQTVTNNWVPTATGGLSSTGGATVDPASNNTVGSTAEYFFITPQFVTPTNGEIRFYTKQGSFSNKGTTYQLRISTANQPDISSFNVVLQSWTETQLNVAATTYEEKIVPIPTIPAGISVYIAFVAITNQTGTSGTAGDKWFVDNVRAISACVPVTAVTTVVGTDNAVINWTHPTATNFGVEVVASGAGHGTTGTPVNGTTYTVNNLLSNTTYDFYIITNCDADTTSAWAGPFSFTTSQAGLNCGTPIVIPSDVSTTPYILNSNLNQFYTTDHPDLTTVGSNCYPAGTYNLLLGNRIFFSYTPSTSGLIDITQTNSVIAGGGPNACYNASSSVMVYNSCADVGENCLAAITTGSNNTTSQISNFYVEAGHTYVIVMSSPYQHTNPGASICFSFVVSGSSCPAPAPVGTNYNNLTQTSANFSWSNVADLVSSWQYVVLPVVSGAPNDLTVLTTTATNLNNPATGLTPATDYNLYVRSVCNGTAGPWAAPVLFTTPCNVLLLPYYTGFTSSDPTVECWSQLNLNNDLNFFSFGNNAFSEPVAKCRTQNSYDILVSPQFQLDGVTQKRLRFKFNNYGNWGLIVNNPVGGKCTFEVRLSTTGVGPNNFTTVVLPAAEYTTAYNFVEIFVPIPNVVGNINIAWILGPGALQEGNWFYVDDVYIEDLPSCSEPSYPIVTPDSLTSDSATISWTNGFNNTEWELVAQPLGTGIPTTTPAPGALVFNNITTNPFTLTGLNPSTRYEFYMRAVCSTTDKSIWVGPINFNTLCIAQPTPYYESLNTEDPNTKKFCWSVINNSDELTRWRIEATEAQIRAASTMFQPFVSFDDWLVSAPINAVGLKRLRFSHRAINGIFNPTPRGNVEVLMSTSQDFSSFTVLIPSFDFTNLAYEEKSVLFTGTGTIYIAFRVPPTMANPGSSGIMMIDDVYIDDAPACPDPTYLSVTDVTSSSASLSWTMGYTETQWQIAVQPIGNGTPSGSGLTVDTTPAYSAIGLTPDTLYEYYVRAVCSGNGNSTWVGPITFRTKCNPLPTPFIETFDSNSTTETCWTIVNGNGDTNDWNLNSTVNPIFGDQMSALFTGSNGNNNDWLITPTLTVQPNQRLRFYYKVYDEFFEEDLKVMLSTNGAGTNQFSTILYENSFNSFTDASGVVEGSNTITLGSAQEAARVKIGDFIYIPGFPFPYPTYVANVSGTLITMTTNATITQTGVQNIQFEHEAINNEEVKEMVINLTDITTPTDINIGFHTPFFPPNPWAYRSQYTFIDNVIVEDIPTCASVLNATSSNLIDTSVTLNWEEVGTATSWEISVQPFGTAAPVGNTLPQYLTTTTTHPKTIIGLIPATQYQYYIRAICSGSLQSEWVGPFEFTTRCDFTNVCQYTITTISGNSGQVSQSVNVMQNGVVVQELEFPGFGQTTIDYTVFLCTGVAFNLYWDGLGSGVQYSQAQIIVKDELNNIVWTSPLGLGTVNTNIYSGFASCGVITCPQPTNTTVSNQGVFSWSPGGTETQWEVFVQPLNNGTLPQSGTVVNSPTYTPTASDFTNPTSSTYEYFVRAICGPTNKSYWSGPKVFVRNDEPTTAVTLQVNTGSVCDVSGVDVSFIEATPSSTPTSCGGINGGDVWFDFVATSKIHTIELSDFAPGNYYTSSYEGPWPKIMMSVYEVMPDGSLVEKGCSENNSFVASYSTELVVGQTYKIRLKLDSATTNDKKFHICITTPPDLCNLNAFNYDFEKLPMQGVTGVATIINATVVPGWRVNTEVGQLFFQEQNNSLNVTPYSGGQCVQLIHDNESFWNPSDPNIKGLYKDFDTSEIPRLDYSFASATRTSSTTLQLFAGPPSGPFTLVTEHNATSLVWQLIEGKYMVPPGQTMTRFIFRVKNYTGGHILDAANFKANTDIEIATENRTIDCNTTSMNFEANGVGVWEADLNNPAPTTIVSPSSGQTAVSGFTALGNYVFHWKTRYCDKTVTITKQGNTETAVVVNPTLYCLNATASPLAATVAAGNTVQWFTQAVGGVGTAIPPTPITTTLGNSQVFYAASIDENGCEGIRSQIVVQIDDLPTITGTLSACIGNTTQLIGSGTAATTNAWSSSNTAVATVSATGLVSGVSAGTATITFTNSSGCQVTAIVTIDTLPTITGSLGACVGNTTQLTGSATAATTNAWTSSDTAVATVSITGLVTGVSAGTSTITYTNSDGCQVTAIVTINGLPTITGTLSACIGNTAQLTGSGTAATTNAWSSSSTAVAIISATGLLTGVSVGTSTITYINSNGCQITANVTVSSQITTSFLPIVGCQNGVVLLPTQSQEGITGTWLPNTINTATLGTNSYAFTPDTSIPSQSCAVAGSLSVTINALPTITGTLVACVGNTTQLAGSATAATTNAWTSSNTAVATISATGLVTGVNAGTSTITYINSNGCQVTAIITINGLPTITGTLSACIGNTTQLIGNGTAATTNAWSSSNTAVATVSATGLVSGVSAGTATITFTNSSGCQVTAIVTIDTLPTITGSLGACVGNTTQLTGSATAATTNAWTSSDTAVATVSITGLVTGVSAGTSTITYTNSDGCQVTAIVTINGLPTITGTLSACIGNTAQLTGSGTAATTNAWSSSSTAVAIISATGLLTGVSVGTSTITYINSNGCQITANVTVSSQITTSFLPIVGCQNGVVLLPTQSQEGITGTWLPNTINTATLGTNSYAFTPDTSIPSQSCAVAGSLSVTINALPTITGTLVACVGNTTQLAGSATAATTNAWTSSNTAVATISATGLVTGVNAGTSTITYINSNGCQVTAIITINGLPTITGTLSACIGNTTQLIGSGTVATTNAWSSSNTAVATVSATGLVSGVSIGTSTITYMNSNGCQTTATFAANALATPNITFSYAQTCINATNPLPVLTPNFAAGGVYSSPTVTVNPATGAVSLATATAGLHVITYALAANLTTCIAAATSVANLIITSGVNPVTGFTYNSSYCTTSSNALPSTSAGFTTGGTFTATPSGLTINNTTGEINISGSSSGTYNVVYSIAENATTCTIADSSDFTLTISAIPVVVIDDICENQELVLEALPVNSSFNPNDVTYTWSVSNTPILGSNTSKFNVDDYLTQTSANLPLQFSVSVSLNGCAGFDDFDVAYNPCKNIPRGISPNDDGDNDTFDLTGMGVKEITIFNRYGVNVFYYNGTYTNQWSGQSDQGDKLPDGTYFYSIHTVDGTSKTGWVYINRQY